MNRLAGRSIKSFKIIRPVGSGQTATVYQGIDTLNNEPVAIKVININSEYYEVIRNKAIAQASIIQRCNNQNIIKYVDAFEASNFFFIIVTEFCNEGDLREYLMTHQLSQATAVAFLKQILNGFNGIHKIGVMHRDFKAANILLHDGVCKIADFGLSKQLGAGFLAKSNVGTPLTNAPEVLAGQPYGFQADIWSIGVLFYQMLYQRYPYEAISQEKILQKIRKGELKFPNMRKKISEESVDFIKRCLKADPKQRISWAQIYKHPLITKSQLYNTSQSEIPIQNNLIFYLTTKLIETEQQPLVTVLEDIKSIITQNDMEQISKSFGHLPDPQISQRFQELYLDYRDDTLFFCQFVQGYLPNVQQVQANHQILGFVMSKKCYLDLFQVYKSLVDCVPIFLREPHFKQFCKQKCYENLTSMFLGQLKRMETICQKYKEQIAIKVRYCTCQLKEELQDLTKSQSLNYNGIVNEYVGDYLRILTGALRECEGEVKKNVIIILKALSYYINNPKVRSYQYRHIKDQDSLSNFEERIKKRYSVN